jgi:RNA polymerase sigma-70 factor, ECF subfamily
LSAQGDVVEKVVGGTRAPGDGADELEQSLESHRAELIRYCSRMLGSRVEAEDAVQEALTRAWCGRDRFKGRAALRSWLYSIATNVCIDHAHGRRRRAHPIDFGPDGSAASLVSPLKTPARIAPAVDPRVHEPTDPADAAVSREEVRLAFVVVFRHLPPRQRAVLILREVLRWRAKEVADLLGVSVPSVNSALQRARAKLAARRAGTTGRDAPQLDDVGSASIARFVDAFARNDFDTLVEILSEDITRPMPPYDSLRGVEAA